MKRILQAFTALVLAASLFFMAGTASADANDITKQCKYAVSSNTSSAKRATDGSLSTMWKSKATTGETFDITIKDGLVPGGLYIRWNVPPKGWTLTALDAGGAELAALGGGRNSWLAEYVELPETFARCAKIRLSTADAAGMTIVELSVYGQGGAPEFAPKWQPMEGRVDILVISAHPDDDVLYLGAVIPTYAQQGKSAVTVFMTTGKPLRRFEAMEGAWIEGERVHPVFGPFPDAYNSQNLSDMNPQKRAWPKEKVLEFLVEQIRKYKPSVIVTHDPKGEYGHGAHKWTSELMSLAFEQAGDPALYPESTEKYGTWAPAKLYKHLLKENQLTIDTRVELPLFGGRTAFDVAKLAYTRHKSQHIFSFKVQDTGKYSIREFGLASTHVGQDSAHDSMFENVTDEAILGLNPAYNWFVVDRAALIEAVARAEAIDTTPFTDESVTAADLPGAIAAAKAILEQREATQAEVDDATAALDAAPGKLVEKRKLTGIAIAAPPQKLLYLPGEPLDLAGLAVTASYSDGTSEPVAVTAENVSGFDSAAPASGQTVTVTHEGLSATFTVDVVDTGSLLTRLLRWLGFVE